MLHIDRKKCHPPKSVDKSRYNRRKYSSNRGERAMNRNLPYMKIAVCTSEVQIGEQIREYVDEFTGKGNAQIQVDVMKNCYRLAKKILNREHYDVICIGKNLRDIDSYTFASSISMSDRETIFFLPGWNRLNLNQIEHLRKRSSTPASSRSTSVIGTGIRYISFMVKTRTELPLFLMYSISRYRTRPFCPCASKERYLLPGPRWLMVR